MGISKEEVETFYRGVADRLDALRQELPAETVIDTKFAAFLATAAREIREDTDIVARKLSRDNVWSFPTTRAPETDVSPALHDIYLRLVSRVDQLFTGMS